MWPFTRRQRYPDAIDPEKVGEYPALVGSGAGYFYDDVLEYRVWVHPEAGGDDLHDGEDYFHAFAAYEEALRFSRNTRGAEEPLVLVRQNEHINEPEPGSFVHIKEERIAEWRVGWLAGNKRKPDSIARFLEEHGNV